MRSNLSSGHRLGSRRRWGAALVAVSVATGLLATAPTALADHNLEEFEGAPPQEIVDRFADCPLLPPDIQGLLCLKVRAYDGDIKLGSVEAQIDDPIEISLAIGLGPGLTPVIALPESAPASPGNILEQVLADLLGRTSACSRGVPISGGLLGLAELDALLANDPLSVLCLSAEPGVGSPQVPDAFGFLGYLFGAPEPVVLGVPLSIKLNNLLLGQRCYIGTPGAPILINLTNGTTAPPEGVEPISGSNGEHVTQNYDEVGYGSHTYASVTGSRFVDNGFTVPGARGCDLVTGDLLGQPGGLLDSTINGMVGLPSGPGRNHALFSLDTEFLTYPSVHRTALEVSPAALDFGSIAVGQASEPQTVTVTNIDNTSVVVGTSLPTGLSPSYRVDGPGCIGETLPAGESCTFEVRFTPNGAGARDGNLSVTGAVNNALLALTGTGTGTAPLTAPPAAFGSVFLDEVSPSQLVTFTNGGADAVTVDGSAALVGTASRFSSWEVVDDGCAGQTVAAGASCSVEVRLAPEQVGNLAVSLEIRGPGGAFLGTASLTGTGTLPLAAPVTAFGSVALGASAGPQTVMFTNNSSTPVEVTAAAVTGTSSRLSSWVLGADTCTGQTVPGGGTCSVAVTFAPQSPIGTKTVTLSLLRGETTVGTASLTGIATA